MWMLVSQLRCPLYLGNMNVGGGLPAMREQYQLALDPEARNPQLAKDAEVLKDVQATVNRGGDLSPKGGTSA